MAEISTAGKAAPSAGGDLSRLLALLQQATPEQKALIRDSIGAGGIKRRKRSGSNADARQFVTRFGEVQHPEGFRVMPPQGVYERGPAAVAAWFARREEGMSITDAELDSIVAAAVQ